MRVAFITEVPTPYRTPLFRLIRGSTDLRVLYCAVNDPWRGSAQNDLETWEEVLPGTTMGGRRGGIAWKVNPSVVARLSALEPAVVVVGGYAHPTMQLAIYWCKRRGVPYILHSESQDLSSRSIWRRALKWPIAKWAIKGAAAFLPVSTPASDYLSKRGAPRDRMFLLPNSPDVRRIAASVDTYRKRVDRDDRPTVLFVGRLVEAKGIDTLLSALALVKDRRPNVRTIICGDGPLRSSAEDRSASLGIAIEIRGHVSEEGLIRAYAEADCFVLPSTNEAFGVVVMEALAAGVPVVISDRVGSGPDLIEQGVNGAIVPCGDAEQLADSIVEMMRPTDRIRRVASAQSAAFGWDHNFCLASFSGALRLATH